MTQADAFREVEHLAQAAVDGFFWCVSLCMCTCVCACACVCVCVMGGGGEGAEPESGPQLASRLWCYGLRKNSYTSRNSGKVRAASAREPAGSDGDASHIYRTVTVTHRSPGMSERLLQKLFSLARDVERAGRRASVYLSVFEIYNEVGCADAHCAAVRVSRDNAFARAPGHSGPDVRQWRKAGHPWYWQWDLRTCVRVPVCGVRRRCGMRPCAVRMWKSILKQNGGTQIQDLTRREAHSLAEAIAFCEAGGRNRATAATAAHPHSSRSHSVVMIDVDSTCVSMGARGLVFRVYVRLCPLCPLCPLFMSGSTQTR